MKKSRVLISMVILALFASAAFATTFVTIGSGGVGGTYYPLGGVMAELLTKGNVDINGGLEGELPPGGFKQGPDRNDDGLNAVSGVHGNGGIQR